MKIRFPKLWGYSPSSHYFLHVPLLLGVFPRVLVDGRVERVFPLVLPGRLLLLLSRHVPWLLVPVVRV